MKTSHVGPRGLQDDRRWMLVDADGLFLSQRTREQMALFRITSEKDRYVVTGPDGEVIALPPCAEGPLVSVRVWSSEVDAVSVSAEVDAWFSEKLGMAARLVWMPDSSIRPTDPEFSQEGDQVGFADAYPVLVISEASLAELNGRLEEPIPMNRFRPNIVVKDAGAYEEDGWAIFTIGGVTFRRAKQCGRCRVTTTSQETAVVGTEPLRTLATYRRDGNRIIFGTYFIPENTGIVSVGDRIENTHSAT